jgi:hypothetical protein
MGFKVWICIAIKSSNTKQLLYKVGGERVGKELSVHRIQNLLSPDRVLHTTQWLVYQRLQNTNLLAAGDFSRTPFLERKVFFGEKLLGAHQTHNSRSGHGSKTPEL